MRSFWKILFINPPEAQRQVVNLQIYRQVNDDAKVSLQPRLAQGVNNFICFRLILIRGYLRKVIH